MQRLSIFLLPVRRGVEGLSFADAADAMKTQETDHTANAVASIEAVLAAYQAAVLAKDVDTFVALYTHDVQVYDMWGAWSHDGIDAWRAMAQGWFGSLGDERVAVGVDDLRVHAGHDVATAQAFLTFTALSPDGRPLRSLNNRLTIVLVRRGGVWKIVHEHTSGPADFKTMKVDIRRPQTA